MLIKAGENKTMKNQNLQGKDTVKENGDNIIRESQANTKHLPLQLMQSYHPRL